jgi:hypothetical protein
MMLYEVWTYHQSVHSSLVVQHEVIKNKKNIYKLGWDFSYRITESGPRDQVYSTLYCRCADIQSSDATRYIGYKLIYGSSSQNNC